MCFPVHCSSVVSTSWRTWDLYKDGPLQWKCCNEGLQYSWCRNASIWWPGEIKGGQTYFRASPFFYFCSRWSGKSKHPNELSFHMLLLILTLLMYCVSYSIFRNCCMLWKIKARSKIFGSSSHCCYRGPFGLLSLVKGCL